MNKFKIYISYEIIIDIQIIVLSSFITSNEIPKSNLLIEALIKKQIILVKDSLINANSYIKYVLHKHLN